MKLNLSLLVLALACISVAHAQTEKGTKTLGLSVSYSSQETENANWESKTKLKYFGIGPTFSYFISDKLDIGAGLSYSWEDHNQDAEGAFYNNQEAKWYGASVFLRKHIMFSDQFGLRTGPFAIFGKGESTMYFDDSSTRNLTTNNFQGGLNLGIEYFPTKRIGIAANLASLSYSYSKEKIEQTTESVTKTNSFGLDVTNGLNLSIFLVFGGK